MIVPASARPAGAELSKLTSFSDRVIVSTSFPELRGVRLVVGHGSVSLDCVQTAL